MTTVSCIVVTTLVVVSLANLVLLVHVIMHSLAKCDRPRTVLQKVPKIPKIQKREDVASLQEHAPSTANYKFMGALVLLRDDDDDSEFVCGVAIISKKWVLTAAHCVEAILDQSKDKVKVSSGAVKFKYGFWHDVDKMIVHEKYTFFEYANNVALVSVVQQFKGKDVTIVPLPSVNYKYLASSNATALAWSRVEVFAINVKLLLHKQCQSAHFDRVDDGVFCAERKTCVLDYGGLLVQKGVMVGSVTFGVGCGTKPVVYSKISVFEEWIKSNKVGAVFKER
jgi:secreted trypsin-like serine protease